MNLRINYAILNTILVGHSFFLCHTAVAHDGNNKNNDDDHEGGKADHILAILRDDDRDEDEAFHDGNDQHMKKVKAEPYGFYGGAYGAASSDDAAMMTLSLPSSSDHAAAAKPTKLSRRNNYDDDDDEEFDASSYDASSGSASSDFATFRTTAELPFLRRAKKGKNEPKAAKGKGKGKGKATGKAKGKAPSPKSSKGSKKSSKSDNIFVTPTSTPTVSASPSAAPSDAPSSAPSASNAPSQTPSSAPSTSPSLSAQPSLAPSTMPSLAPTDLCDSASFLESVASTSCGGNSDCTAVLSAVQNDRELAKFFACQDNSATIFNDLVTDAGRVARFAAAVAATSVPFFTGDSATITQLCMDGGHDCCPSSVENPCDFDGIVTIAANACVGKEACQDLADNALIFSGSCTAQYACDGLNANTDGLTIVYQNSCTDPSGCFKAGYNGLSDVLIGPMACTDNYACQYIAFRAGVNSDGYGPFVGGSDIIILSGACVGYSACYGAHSFDSDVTLVYTYKVRGSITVEQNACVGSRACYRAMYGNYHAAGLLIRAGECTGSSTQYSEEVCQTCALDFICYSDQTLAITEGECPDTFIDGDQPGTTCIDNF
mmetsp:Transcript_5359/g.15737  ORF Transcript_5359/g.15737 Transcript_5359/m.15737 type:complete len:602 (+) Transcript_5359:132-1937(+)